MIEVFAESVDSRLVKTSLEEVEAVVSHNKDEMFLDYKTLDRLSFAALIVTTERAGRNFKEDELGLDIIPSEGEYLEKLRDGELPLGIQKTLIKRGVDYRNIAFTEVVEAYDDYLTKSDKPRISRVANTKLVRRVARFEFKERQAVDIDVWTASLGMVSRALLVTYD